MIDEVTLETMQQILQIGCWGVLSGVLMPFLFRLVGYLADVMFIALDM